VGSPPRNGVAGGDFAALVVELAKSYILALKNETRCGRTGLPEPSQRQRPWAAWWKGFK
jgi:hypothetical protein